MQKCFQELSKVIHDLNPLRWSPFPVSPLTERKGPQPFPHRIVNLDGSPPPPSTPRKPSDIECCKNPTPYIELGPWKSQVLAYLFLPKETILQELGQNLEKKTKGWIAISIFCVVPGEEPLIKNRKSIPSLLGKFEILKKSLSPIELSSPSLEWAERDLVISLWKQILARVHH